MNGGSGVAKVPSSELVQGVIDGDVHSIARMISRVEARDDEARVSLRKLYTHTGHAHIVGITGVPGSGKSTLVRVLALAARKSGRRVGILAIDPSSPFSGGSILGDRIRMNDLSEDKGIFIRSMATRGALGGLARSAMDAVDVLDAAGFDLILVETVGVGQDEVDVVKAAHTTVVVSAPGLGDEIQAIKAGVLEIADIHTVTKCDRPDANKTISELKGMLMLGVSLTGPTAWQTPVIGTSSPTGVGIDDLLAMIDKHYKHLVDSGELAKRCRLIATARVMKGAEDIIRERFAREQHAMLEELTTRVATRELDPYSAASQMIAPVTN